MIRKDPGYIKHGSPTHRAMLTLATALSKRYDIGRAPAMAVLLKLEVAMRQAIIEGRSCTQLDIVPVGEKIRDV